MKMNQTIDQEGNPIDPGKLKYAVIGLLFSVNDFDQRITARGNQTLMDFFSSLKLDDETEPFVDEVKLGSLLDLADFQNRWVYHGSLTTPPCSPEVYWNVINFVYPINEKEIGFIQAMMARNEKKIGGLTTNRVLQPIKQQGIRYLRAKIVSATAALVLASSILLAHLSL